MSADVVEVLREARECLATNQWGQGPHYRRPNTYCAGEALEACRANTDSRERAWLWLCQTIGHVPLVVFNDAPGRTKEQVLEAFDRAIALASQESSP